LFRSFELGHSILSFDWAQDGEPFDAAHGREPAERLVEPFRVSIFGLPWRDIARIHYSPFTISGPWSLYEYFASQVWARDFGFKDFKQRRSTWLRQHALRPLGLLAGKVRQDNFWGGIRTQPEGVVKPCSCASMSKCKVIRFSNSSGAGASATLKSIVLIYALHFLQKSTRKPFSS